jgi:transcriptional regulator with XRE-family HTH domain
MRHADQRYPEFGAELRRLREARGLSLREVERRSRQGISHPYLVQIEQEGKIPNPQILAVLAKIYEVPQRKLFLAADDAMMRRPIKIEAPPLTADQQTKEILRGLANVSDEGKQLALARVRELARLYPKAQTDNSAAPKPRPNIVRGPG